MKTYFYNIFVSLNLVMTSIFGCELYESTCAAAWRMRHYLGVRGIWARTLVKVTNRLVEVRHCERAYRAHKRLKRYENGR